MTSFLNTLKAEQEAVLKVWTDGMRAAVQRRDLLSERDLETQAQDVLNALVSVPADSRLEEFGAPVWRPLKDLLAQLSVSRATMGFSPSETALFVLSMKPALFAQVRARHGSDGNSLFAELTAVDTFVDKLGLFTTDNYIQGRDQVIARQQEDMLELSTPVVTLWDGIVALPLIGTLDSARTQVVMETLLQAIVTTDSRVAIIDITGVPTVDTLVAQHLLKTITAARLMGAECILSGIRPQIAQTIVHLGIDLTEITTKARLSDAFRVALDRTGRKVTRAEKKAAGGLEAFKADKTGDA